MVELGEIRIENLNESWALNGAAHGADPDTDMSALDLMKKVYNEVLHVDGNWHFFWEGSYTVIRCNKLLIPHAIKLINEVTSDDIFAIEDVGGYDENIKITKKYIEAFVPIFHGFSVLAMEMDEEDFLLVLERINHCFLNMVTRHELKEQFRIPSDKIEIHHGMGWEGLAIHAVASMRVWTAGFFRGESHGINKTRKYYGDKKD